MKRISKIFSVVFCLILLAGLGAQLSAASAPYETYTYSINGMALTSPHAYTPSASITSYEMNLPTALNAPRDIFVDENGKIYISDTGNNRVVVCNSSFVAEFEISEFTNENGVQDALSSPRGLFVNEDTIYVCDWQNSRIVLFDLEGKFKEIIEAPTADVMGSDTLFRPTAVAVSESGMIYVVSSTTYSGIIALNPDGSFQSFLGAQQTSVSLAVRIRRMLFPNVVTQSYISTPYQNLTIDDEGLIWATIIFGEDEIPMLENAISSGATNSIYAPVKQLNPRGDDIMTRNGFFMPAGEINFGLTEFQNDSSAYGSVFGPSSLVDIALGPNGMWSVIDSKRSKIYTYDNEGNLLFAFGDQGRQLGNLASPVAITYAGSDIYVLDSVMNSITIFQRTDYGDAIDQALYHNSIREYSAAYSDWQEILRRNINFDAAYVGIGKTLYRQGEYAEAMEYYKMAYETENYSTAFQSYRQEIVEKYILLIVVIVVVVLILVAKFFKYVGKKNKAGEIKTGKRTLWEEFLYGFHVIMHPFDGFWDLKHEKRGSVRGAVCIVALTVLSVAYQMIGSAYLFGGGYQVNLIFPIITVLGPLMLWCVANWCLTTLFDGEGSFKDIFISTSYAILPIPLIGIPATICTNFLSLAEAEFITLFLAISYIWAGALIFFGSMTTHGYSMGRNVVITFFTIVGMVFILFIILLFTNLIQQMVSFITNIITELSYRAQ